MSETGIRTATDGFWRNNPALVQFVGLCPLLAVTTSVVNGVTLGIATMLVLLMTNVLISSIRSLLVPSVRIPLFVLVIASFVTCVDILMNALLFDLHEVLGLFVPLIITNCAILAQAETVASRQPVAFSAVAAVATGAGFLAVLAALGAIRELLGAGTLLAGFEQLIGPAGASLRIDIGTDGILVAVLPPGAFFGLAALLAARNLWLDRRRKPQRTPDSREAEPTT